MYTCICVYNKCRIFIAKNMTFMEVTQYELIPKILFTSSVTEDLVKCPEWFKRELDSVEIYRVGHLGLKN